MNTRIIAIRVPDEDRKRLEVIRRAIGAKTITETILYAIRKTMAVDSLIGKMKR